MYKRQIVVELQNLEQCVEIVSAGRVNLHKRLSAIARDERADRTDRHRAGLLDDKSLAVVSGKAPIVQNSDRAGGDWRLVSADRWERSVEASHPSPPRRTCA